jgi:hypothetical protein
MRGLFDDQTTQDLRDSSIALAVSDGIDIFGAGARSDHGAIRADGRARVAVPCATRPTI